MLKHMEKMAIVMLYIMLGLGLSMAVLLSARAYTNAENLAASGAQARVADQYLRMKIRQGDVANAIHVDNNNRIYITESYPEGVFDDVLYLYNNTLSEQLVGSGVEFYESAGDSIFSCDQFGIHVTGPALYYDLVVDGTSQTGCILMRSGSGEGAVIK